MNADRINELPICARLTHTLVSGITGTTKEHLVNPDGPEASALIETLVDALEEIGASNIRPGSRYNERLAGEYERVQRVARAALAKARAQ
jgi:hypothetical protein